MQSSAYKALTVALIAVFISVNTTAAGETHGSEKSKKLREEKLNPKEAIEEARRIAKEYYSEFSQSHFEKIDLNSITLEDAQKLSARLNEIVDLIYAKVVPELPSPFRDRYRLEKFEPNPKEDAQGRKYQKQLTRRAALLMAQLDDLKGFFSIKIKEPTAELYSKIALIGKQLEKQGPHSEAELKDLQKKAREAFSSLREFEPIFRENSKLKGHGEFTWGPVMKLTFEGVPTKHGLQNDVDLMKNRTIDLIYIQNGKDPIREVPEELLRNLTPAQEF